MLTEPSGTYFWFGGMLLTLGGLLEWIMGNTFPCTVFTTFGGSHQALTALLTLQALSGSHSVQLLRHPSTHTVHMRLQHTQLVSIILSFTAPSRSSWLE